MDVFMWFLAVEERETLAHETGRNSGAGAGGYDPLERAIEPADA